MRNQIREDVSDLELARLEEKILKEGLLKIDKTPKDTFAVRRSLKLAVADILETLTRSYWDSYDENKNTVYVKNGRKQCGGNNFRRSQGDLFRITKYYYPDTTFKEFRAALFELTNECKVQTSYCNTIYKRVFYSTGRTRVLRRFSFIYSPEIKDELGLILKVEMV